MSSRQQGQRHTILTCYDDRIDGLVEQEIECIRAQGGIIREKDINRPPGGVHLFTGRSDCREAFYSLLRSCSDIAKSTVFHFWPHTNCQHCGRYHPEKIGTNAQSDLRYHLRSAEKMLGGALGHFSGSVEQMPELDVRIILTIDQRIVTIDEAHTLLPHVSEHSHHGSSCIGGHDHRHEHQHHTAVHYSHGSGHEYDIRPLP